VNDAVLSEFPGLPGRQCRGCATGHGHIEVVAIHISAVVERRSAQCITHRQREARVTATAYRIAAGCARRAFARQSVLPPPEVDRGTSDPSSTIATMLTRRPAAHFASLDGLHSQLVTRWCREQAKSSLFRRNVGVGCDVAQAFGAVSASSSAGL
jgi:hypothetical protein